MLRRKAFTIVEVLVVIILIGVMATFVAPKMGQVREKAIFSEGVAMIRALDKGQKMYYLEHGAYTTNCADLDGAAVLNPSNWKPPECYVHGIVALQRADNRYWIATNEFGKFLGDNPIVSSNGAYRYLKPLCPNNCEPD